MPTYDYRCRDCGTTVELIHGMTEDGPTVCEVCGGPMRRVLFPTGIIFKGSGFYRTDSRSSGTTSGASSTPSSTDTSSTSAAGGTESATPSKPDSSSNPKPKPAAASD